MTDDRTAPSLPPVDPAAADRVPLETLTPELLASLLADGDDELAAWALRHALAEAPRPVVYDGLLRGAMQLVGERWETGQWSVAEEHLASRTLLRVLERVRPEPRGPEDRLGPLAVLAGIAGEQHMIGLVCLEHVLAERGWVVANLGADVPPDDLARFVTRNDVALVALSASDPARLDALASAVTVVRAGNDGRRIPILLGGRLADSGAGVTLPPGIDWTGTSLVEAAAFAATIAPGHITGWPGPAA